MKTDRDRLIQKIKKCLRLSRSSNEHEAAAALRQARKLMEAAQVTESDLLASEVSEARARASAQIRVPFWENYLAGVVAKGLGVSAFFSTGMSADYNRALARMKQPQVHGEWVFVGVNGADQVACFAFTVLHRQLKRARADFIARRCRRCKTSTRIERADAFCVGWAWAVESKVQELIPSERDRAAMDLYLARYALQKTDREVDFSGRDEEYLRDGLRAGRSMDLRKPMGGASAQQALS